jgi:hypothetical protein
MTRYLHEERERLLLSLSLSLYIYIYIYIYIYKHTHLYVMQQRDESPEIIQFRVTVRIVESQYGV